MIALLCSKSDEMTKCVSVMTRGRERRERIGQGGARVLRHLWPRY
jgi:hypothetical protein